MKTTKKVEIKNNDDLRSDVINVYEELRQGKMTLREAKELTNTAGKIMSSAKIQLEYNIFMKAPRKIEFLEAKKDDV